MATCPRCERELPVDEFARDASKASGHKSYCKRCDAARCRDYYSRNREQVIARMLAAREPVEPRELVCPGCGEPFTAKGRQRYCKPSHRPGGDRGAKVQAVCAWCGGEFEARARDRARGGGRFCCKSHALRARNSPAAGRRRGRDHARTSRQIPREGVRTRTTTDRESGCTPDAATARLTDYSLRPRPSKRG